MPPKEPEIPTVKVTVRLTIKKIEDGPSELTVTTEKSVKPSSSAKGWFIVPKDFPATSLDFQTTMLLWDALKGLQGLYIWFSPSSDKRPLSDSNPMQMGVIFFNGPHTSSNDNWSASLQLADTKLKNLSKWDALGWAVWT